MDDELPGLADNVKVIDVNGIAVCDVWEPLAGHHSTWVETCCVKVAQHLDRAHHSLEILLELLALGKIGQLSEGKAWVVLLNYVPNNINVLTKEMPLEGCDTPSMHTAPDELPHEGVGVLG